MVDGMTLESEGGEAMRNVDVISLGAAPPLFLPGLDEQSDRWETFSRSSPLQLDEGDGRTLTGRIVPYNVVTEVADPPYFRPYKESFLPGAFRAQLNAANRVFLNYMHRQGLQDVIGHGTALEEQPDGLYGTFRVLNHADGDKALELYHAGILRGLSTEFSIRKSRVVNGVTQRVDARLGNVALCRDHASGIPNEMAAYPGAEVLSVRTDNTENPLEAPESDPNALDAPTVRNPSLVPPLDLERLAAIGIQPVLTRAIVRKPWDGSPARFTDEQYQRSCLVCRGTGAPPKEDCSLPVLEPNGDLNVNALGAAAAALRGARGGVRGLSSAMKATAARKLMRYYNQAGMTPPPGISMMGGQ